MKAIVLNLHPFTVINEPGSIVDKAMLCMWAHKHCGLTQGERKTGEDSIKHSDEVTRYHRFQGSDGQCWQSHAVCEHTNTMDLHRISSPIGGSGWHVCMACGFSLERAVFLWNKANAMLPLWVLRQMPCCLYGCYTTGRIKSNAYSKEKPHTMACTVYKRRCCLSEQTQLYTIRSILLIDMW